jgi:hypothetical protein
MLIQAMGQQLFLDSVRVRFAGSPSYAGGSGGLHQGLEG